MRENLAILLIALSLSLGIIAIFPAAFRIQVPRAHAASSFTLVGEFGVGWGFTSTTVTTPGPTLTVVKGTSVTLTLSSGDGLTHNWGVDYDGDGICDHGEPCSGNFAGTTTLTFPFTATTNTGSFTYWCFIHKGAMVGTFVVKSNFALFGAAFTGWGSTSASIATPGPTLVASPGTVVTMNLTSADGLTHNWGIDYNNDGLCEVATEPCSTNFGTIKSMYTFTTTTIPGNYTYYCFIHFAPMVGTFVVRFPHDVAVSGLATSRNSAYSGATFSKPVQVNVTAQNLGANPENFAVYAKANSTLIGNKTITLGPGVSTVVTFNWTKTDTLSRGNYILTANATKVNGETIFGNNQLTGNIFIVKLRGDVNGDCKVNIFDLTSVGGTFGSATGSAGFNQEADLNNDGKINIFDLTLVGGNFGATC